MRFPWQRKKQDLLSPSEQEAILEAIRKAEMRTSGEVRLFIESRCRYVDALDRAAEIFQQLRMADTELRNATLIYVAVKDRQTAVFGDEGIHEKVGQIYWEDVVKKMMLHFRQQNLVDGICESVKHIGEALHFYFPYDKDSDKNELPDEIVFGK